MSDWLQWSQYNTSFEKYELYSGLQPFQFDLNFNLKFYIPVNSQY